MSIDADFIGQNAIKSLAIVELDFTLFDHLTRAVRPLW